MKTKRLLSAILALVMIISLSASAFAAKSGDNEESKIVNILLLGTDVRNSQTADPGRADCELVLSLNFDTGEVKYISFENGIIVPLPEGVSSPDGRRDTYLTQCYYIGGGELAEKTVSESFNLDLTGFAHVDYDAFEDVIDAIGGIDIELTDIEAAALNGKVKTNTFPLKRTVSAGMEHLDGYEALQYVRLLFTDDDWTRQQRQRNLMNVCVDKIRDLSLIDIAILAKTVIPLIETDMESGAMTAIILSLPKFFGSTVKEMQVPDGNMREDKIIECDFGYESKKISDFIYGTDYLATHEYTSPVDENEFAGHTVVK